MSKEIAKPCGDIISPEVYNIMLAYQRAFEILRVGSWFALLTCGIFSSVCFSFLSFVFCFKFLLKIYFFINKKSMKVWFYYKFFIYCFPLLQISFLLFVFYFDSVIKFKVMQVMYLFYERYSLGENYFFSWKLFM